MALFDELRAEKDAIVLSAHEADVSRHARRAVVLACAALGLAFGLTAARAGVHAGAEPDAEPAGSEASARAITLSEALALARQNAPEGIQALGQLRTGRARLRSAYGAFLPGLTLSASTGRGTSEREWSYSGGLNASLELFAGGRRLFDLRQARAGLTAAEANEVSQRYLVDLNVKQQYFDVLAARESEVAARAQVQQAEQQLKTAVLRLRAARATKSDSLRSEIQMRNAQLALVQARTDLETASAALTRAVGASYAVTAAELDTAPLPPLEISEQELSRLAGEGPAVRQARAQRDAARAARASAWTDYLPSLNASYGQSGRGSGTNAAFGAGDLSYRGTLGLSLSMSLFDRLAREEQVVGRAVAVDNAEAGLRDAQLAAREGLTRYLGVLRTAEQRVRAQTTSVAAAEEDLRVQQQRYALGESTLLDVLTSQTQLNDARAALIRARYAQRIARAQLEALIGRDL